MTYTIVGAMLTSKNSSQIILICSTLEYIINKEGIPYNKIVGKWFRKKKFLEVNPGENMNLWIRNNTPYNSFGNMGLIRVIPYIYTNYNLEKCLELAIKNTKLSHSHPKSIKATELLINSLFILKEGGSKKDIFKLLSKEYDLKYHVKELKLKFKEPTVNNTMVKSFVCFLQSSSYEESIENSLSLSGDVISTTILTSTISSLFYKRIDSKFNSFYLNGVSKDIFNLVEKFNNIK